MPKIIQELYNGEIKIEFNPDRHKYNRVQHPREWLISVTSCTGMVDKSRILMAWQERLTREYLMGNMDLLKKSTEDIAIRGIIENAVAQHRMAKEHAADLGTQVHDFAEQWIKAGLEKNKKPELPTDEKVLNGITAFLTWVKENKVKFIASEQLVYSKRHQYVGMLDIKAEVNGKLTLCDLKTSNGVYPEMFMQVSAYRQADEEESGCKYDGMIIIKLDKETGDMEVHEIDNYEKHFKAFKACLELKKWQKNNK